jgi:3-deoxy-7-phosphoheptulonate synthase
MGLDNKNVENYIELDISPEILSQEIKHNDETINFVKKSRENIENILDKKDRRKLIIVGPCSVHKKEEFLEYAKKLSLLNEKVKDKFLILIRAYFEKPRTIVGWKGLIYDPNLDDTNDIVKGLKKTREILLEVTKLKLPIATEFLGTLIPQYISDFISYAAIGARTTESQVHRELASGLSMPIGFKNSTYGDVGVAVNGAKSAMNKHNFLGVNFDGKISIVKTLGNKYSHVILRGGKVPNYSNEMIEHTTQLMKKANVNESIVIDCSHANSGKKHENQIKVFNEVIHQMKDNEDIVGLMIESYLKEGNQDVNEGKYGVSVTDECISFETTEKIILNALQLL